MLKWTPVRHSKSAVGRFSRPRFNDRRLVVGFNDAASATAEKQLEHQKRRLRHAESQGDPTAKRLKIRTDTLAARKACGPVPVHALVALLWWTGQCRVGALSAVRCAFGRAGC